MIFFIAYRYLRSYKKKDKKKIKLRFSNLKKIFSDHIISTSLVSFLTKISTYSLTIGIAALIIILSVFNGLEDFTKSFYDSYNAQLKISPIRGKFFEIDDSLLKIFRQIPDIKAVTPIIEDDILLKYQDVQKVVHFKALDSNYLMQYSLDTVMVSGHTSLRRANLYFALIGITLQYELNIFDTISPIQLWYPHKNINPAQLNLNRSFYKTHVYLGGTFAIDQNYNQENIFLPLKLIQHFLNLPNRATSIEIACETKKSIAKVQKILQKYLGKTFLIQTGEEQQADLLRAIQSERLFVFIGFILIVFIATFNIFFTLSVIVIEKKRDIKTLLTLGMKRKNIYRIFMVLGGLIAVRGGILGIILGAFLCFIQQQYGLVSMGIANAVIDAYPVKMVFQDFLYTVIIVICIVLIISHLPSKNAQNKSMLNN